MTVCGDGYIFGAVRKGIGVWCGVLLMEFNLMEGAWGGCEGRARQSHDSLCGYAGIQQFGIMRQEVIVMATVPAPDIE